MAESIMNHQESEPLVKYYPETETLYITNGKPLGEGDNVAKDVVAFYDKDNECEVVGLYIECAELVLKPFVDAILAKHGVSKVGTSG
ncbi:MAG: DUF2283 domain-containing protein [Dehalococcoidia bacterium]|nr:DUF2283 domain-containing protein [Dehalococcoidia bacterium]